MKKLVTPIATHSSTLSIKSSAYSYGQFHDKGANKEYNSRVWASSQVAPPIHSKSIDKAIRKISNPGLKSSLVYSREALTKGPFTTLHTPKAKFSHHTLTNGKKLQQAESNLSDTSAAQTKLGNGVSQIRQKQQTHILSHLRVNLGSDLQNSSEGLQSGEPLAEGTRISAAGKHAGTKLILIEKNPQESTNSNLEFSQAHYSGRGKGKDRTLLGTKTAKIPTTEHTEISDTGNSQLIQILKNKMSNSKAGVMSAKESQHELKQEYVLNASRDSVGSGTSSNVRKLNQRKSPLLLDLDEASHDRHAYVPTFDAARGVTAVYADCLFSDAEKSWESRADKLRKERVSQESEGEDWIGRWREPEEKDSFEIQPRKTIVKPKNRKSGGISELKSKGLQTKITKYLGGFQEVFKNNKTKSSITQPEQSKTLNKFRPQDGQTNSNQASGASIQISNLYPGTKVMSEYKFLSGWGNILEKAHVRESMGSSRKSKKNHHRQKASYDSNTGLISDALGDPLHLPRPKKPNNTMNSPMVISISPMAQSQMFRSNSPKHRHSGYDMHSTLSPNGNTTNYISTSPLSATSRKHEVRFPHQASGEKEPVVFQETGTHEAPPEDGQDYHNLHLKIAMSQLADSFAEREQRVGQLLRENKALSGQLSESLAENERLRKLLDSLGWKAD